MNIESITTLEEARDFLVARYPGLAVSVDRALWVYSGKVGNDDLYFASVHITSSNIVSGRSKPTLQQALAEVVAKADHYNPAEIARKEVEAARAKLESAGYSVIAPEL